jgi:hypothetical protein
MWHVPVVRHARTFAFFAILLLPLMPGARAQATASPEALCLAGPSPACLIDLAVATSLRVRDEDRQLPALAGAFARAGRFDAAEAIRQRLQHDEARRADTADLVLAGELLWAARQDPNRAADLDALDDLAERPRRGLDGAARRARAYAETARLLCRDHTIAAAAPGAAPNPTLAELLRRWPAAIEARPGRRQAGDWEALSETLACVGDQEAARAALRRAAEAAPGSAHPGRLRAFLALGEVAEAEAAALDVRLDQRVSVMVGLAEAAMRAGRTERAAELAGLAAEAAAGARTAGVERVRALRAVARLRHALGEAAGARAAAEAAQEAAEAPDPLARPRRLLEAAGAFNDIGLGEPACRLAAVALEAAQPAAAAAAVVPPSSRRSGGAQPAAAETPAGPSAPPQQPPRGLGLLQLPGALPQSLARGRLPGVGDEMRAHVAVELHRCGQGETALRMLRETAALSRATGWVEMQKAALAAAAGPALAQPGRFPDLVAADQRGRVAAELAAFHAGREEPEAAAAWITAALDAEAGGGAALAPRRHGSAGATWPRGRSGAPRRRRGPAAPPNGRWTCWRPRRCSRTCSACRPRRRGRRADREGADTPRRVKPRWTTKRRIPVLRRQPGNAPVLGSVAMDGPDRGQAGCAGIPSGPRAHARSGAMPPHSPQGRIPRRGDRRPRPCPCLCPCLCPCP